MLGHRLRRWPTLKHHWFNVWGEAHPVTQSANLSDPGNQVLPTLISPLHPQYGRKRSRRAEEPDPTSAQWWPGIGICGRTCSSEACYQPGSSTLRQLNNHSVTPWTLTRRTRSATRQPGIQYFTRQTEVTAATLLLLLFFWWSTLFYTVYEGYILVGPFQWHHTLAKPWSSTISPVFDDHKKTLYDSRVRVIVYGVNIQRAHFCVELKCLGNLHRNRL